MGVWIEASWETYERILVENQDRPGLRITFDGERLELERPTLGHERRNRRMQALVELLAEELGIDVESVGSLTLKRSDQQRGFEPDSSFYLQSLAAVESAEEIDLTIHPPPDLTIEVEVSRSVLNRFSIFESMGIPEVWTVRDGDVTIYLLRENGYEKNEQSLAFPVVGAHDLTRLLGARETKRSRVWLKETRQWIRAKIGR